jgi:hypothetical protein
VVVRASKTVRRPTPQPQELPKPIASPEIDSGLEAKLGLLLKQLERRVKWALQEATEFCDALQLDDRKDLTSEVTDLVKVIRTYETTELTGNRKRKSKPPKGSPQRDAKGRPPKVQVHIDRHDAVEKFLESLPAGQRSIPKACREVARTFKPQTTGDALEKSYRKVEYGNLYRGHFDPL